MSGKKENDKEKDRGVRLVDNDLGDRVDLGHPAARAQGKDDDKRDIQEGHAAPRHDKSERPTKPPPKREDSDRSATPPAVRKDKTEKSDN